MRKHVSTLTATVVLVVCGAITLDAQNVRVLAKIELPQTIEPAGIHNPQCGDPRPAQLTAGDLLIKAGAAAIDAYLQLPVTSTFLEKMPEGNRQWLRDRLGASQNNGKASCATLCITYPTTLNPTVDACTTETGGDGAHCRTSPADTDFARVENFTKAATGGTTVFCATGKNWSHNKNRWFYVRAHTPQ
jgi:hypothetical protein